MDEWMNEWLCIAKWAAQNYLVVNEWMNEWLNELINKNNLLWLNEWMIIKWMNGNQINE